MGAEDGDLRSGSAAFLPIELFVGSVRKAVRRTLLDWWATACGRSTMFGCLHGSR